MCRSPWKRAFTALLVVMACTLAVPARAATTAPTMDTAFTSAMKLWTKAMKWLDDLWAAPATSGAARGDGFKFGAGHSSDGRSVAKSSAKTAS